MAKQGNRDTFLATMRKRFAQAESDEFHIRAAAEEDLRFVAGDQWDEGVPEARRLQGRPALTFNRLPTFVQQVTNESRQNKPSIKFSPVDNAGDIDTAKVFEGLARHIQHASKAQIAYDTAIEYSASCSFGYFRLMTEYCNDYNGDQDVKFLPVDDPFSVYGVLMPKCFGRKPQWAFVIETLSTDEYEATYGELKHGFDDGQGWITDGFVRVAEYWWTEYKKSEVSYEVASPDGTVEVQTRTVRKPVIKFCKTNGREILDDSETTWPGDCIPIFAALGRKLILKGKPHLFSLVRFQRDPQRMINYYKTAIAERIGLVNRAPYIGYTGQFTDPKWATANAANYAYLEAAAYDDSGRQYPGLPQRQNLDGQIGDLSAAALQEIDDLKAISGIYDASMGAQSNETSGVAIARRQQQSSITNLHFIDNLNRAQEEAGEALAYLIPRVIDTARSVRTVGEDEEERVVRANETYVDENGEEKTYMLEAGKYDVKVNIGPSFTTKRQEAAAAYEGIIKAAPQLMMALGDIYFRNGDMAGNDEAAERMKKFISLTTPGLIEDEKQKQADPQALMQKMMQIEQLNDQLMEQVNVLAQERETKKAEWDFRREIELTKIASAERIKLAELNAADAALELQKSIEVLQHQVEMERAERQADRAAEESDRQFAADQQQPPMAEAA